MDFHVHKRRQAQAMVVSEEFVRGFQRVPHGSPPEYAEKCWARSPSTPKPLQLDR